MATTDRARSPLRTLALLVTTLLSRGVGLACLVPTFECPSTPQCFINGTCIDCDKDSGNDQTGNISSLPASTRTQWGDFFCTTSSPTGWGGHLTISADIPYPYEVDLRVATTEDVTMYGSNLPTPLCGDIGSPVSQGQSCPSTFTQTIALPGGKVVGSTTQDLGEVDVRIFTNVPGDTGGFVRVVYDHYGCVSSCTTCSCCGGGSGTCPPPSDPCQTGAGSCDANSGQCVYPHFPDDTVCGRQSTLCHDADLCKSGLCHHGKNKNVGKPCDDGLPCTTGDTCQSDGSCVGATENCDDGNPCTTDKCTKNGCTHTVKANGTSCSNGSNTCAVGNKCEGGICGACQVGQSCPGCEAKACGGLNCTCVPVQFCGGNQMSLAAFTSSTNSNLYFVSTVSGKVGLDPTATGHGPNEIFFIIPISNGPGAFLTNVAIETADGHYWSLAPDGTIGPTADTIGPNETFLLSDYVHGGVTLTAANGKILDMAGGVAHAVDTTAQVTDFLIPACL